MLGIGKAMILNSKLMSNLLRSTGSILGVSLSKHNDLSLKFVWMQKVKLEELPQLVCPQPYVSLESLGKFKNEDSRYWGPLFDTITTTRSPLTSIILGFQSLL